MLVLIGQHWLATASPGGPPRLHDPADLLRREIATALNRRKWVIPVRVSGPNVPSASDLPEDLAALVDRQAIEVSDERWDYDVDKLAQAVRMAGSESGHGAESRRLVAGAIGAVLLAIALVFGLLAPAELRPNHDGPSAVHV